MIPCRNEHAAEFSVGTLKQLPFLGNKIASANLVKVNQADFGQWMEAKRMEKEDTRLAARRSTRNFDEESQ